MISLVGCKNGPIVGQCIVDKASVGFQCADYKNTFFKSASDADGFVCLSPSHEEALLEFCKVRGPAPVVEYCAFDVQSMNFLCPSSGDKDFLAAENYVCSSPRDAKRLLDFCKRKHP